jgi:hypothetical protein
VIFFFVEVKVFKSSIIFSRYYLTGEKKGSREVFIELPGFGDTIRLTDKKTLMVPLAAARASKFTSLLDLTGKYPFIRHLLGYVKY